jgi:hypothetical protein
VGWGEKEERGREKRERERDWAKRERGGSGGFYLK